MMEKEYELSMIVLILDINHKIIHDGIKYSNMLYVCIRGRTHPHQHTRIYINHTECVNDYKNSRLYNN